MPEQKPKKEYTGFVCGRCRWAIHLNDGRGRCRRNPPSIPGVSAAAPCRHPSIELGALGCGEWVPPPGSRS